MKPSVKKYVVVLVVVMMLAVSQAAVAEYRTGSDVGDAASYGLGGAALGTASSLLTASVAASWAAGALTIACPPAVIVGAATGALMYGAYGYFEPNKTLAKDTVAGIITASASPLVAKYVSLVTAKGVATKALRGAAWSMFIGMATRYKTQGETVDLRKPSPIIFADWAY